jgi:hypothetical protein
MNSVDTPSTAVPPHRPCRDLEDPLARLDDAVYRFILGSDDRPNKLSRQEATQLLGDRFAQLVLLEDELPNTAGEVLDAIERAVPENDPLRTQRFFLVGEDTQIAPIPGVGLHGFLRFLVTVGEGTGGPEIMISASHPDHETVELMAWDHERGGFNYYRTVGASHAWVFAGNSRHALTAPTRGHGPFESHKNGHFLMKELKEPWVHWHSPKAQVLPEVFEGPLRRHPWAEVAKLEPGGAYALEDNVAKPAIRRWTRARLDALVSGNSDETPRRVLEQVLRTLTVNLMSSFTSSAAAVSGAVSGTAPEEVDLPETFFVDSDALSGVLGLARPLRPFVPSRVYAASLRTFDVRLTDDAAFERDGDTHFAFVVPERAFEDTDTLRQANERGILSRRLAACLLMVDFPNPIFSERRQRLLEHVPDIAFGETDDFSETVANTIRDSTAANQPGTPEHEFAQLWARGANFEAPFNALLQDYYTAFAERLGTQEGFDSYMRLAESRRVFVRGTPPRFGDGMPIAESRLLFARTNIPSRKRTMRANGTVEEV